MFNDRHMVAAWEGNGIYVPMVLTEGDLQRGPKHVKAVMAQVKENGLNAYYEELQMIETHKREVDPRWAKS